MLNLSVRVRIPFGELEEKMVFEINIMQEIVKELGNKVKLITYLNLEGRIIGYNTDETVIVLTKHYGTLKIKFNELEFLNDGN